MIKCILFDFDGVLTIDKTGSTSITNYISQTMNISLETIKTSYYKYNKQLLMGEIVHEDMWEDFCDVVAISAEIHSGKEDRCIFQYVLDSLHASAEECVFIDNTAKNLIVPAKMGMRTMLFDDENRDFDAFVQKLNAILQERI